MQTSTKSLARNRSNTTAVHGGCRIEPLESRRLLAFSTVDIIPGGDLWGGMAADASGNVYVGGFDASNTIVRQGSNGGTTWNSILQLPVNYNDSLPDPEVLSVAASPAGDVYAGVEVSVQSWAILERPAGGTQFQQVYSNSTGSLASDFNFLSVDPAGTAYAVSGTAVLRQTGPLGGFAVVDAFPSNHRIRAIAAGPGGVYVVGNRSIRSGNGANATTTYHWIVRKSVSGNSGTWVTVDDFQYDAANNQSSQAYVLSVDASGTVSVAGIGYKKVQTGGTGKKPIYTNMPYALVRTSNNGGASWATDLVSSSSLSEPPYGIDTDSAGNVYVARWDNGSSIVRVKPPGAGSWSVIDQLNAYPEGGLIVDSHDNVYVSGFADGPAGGSSSYGFVREMPAAAPLGLTGGNAGSIFSNEKIADSSNDMLAELA